MDRTIQVATFDIGYRNFSFYVEKFKPNEIRKLKTIDKIEKCGIPIAWERATLLQPDIKGEMRNQQMFINITEYLDTFNDLWKNCSAFMLERQLKINPLAKKIEQHVYSYFTIKYPFKITMDMPASCKSKAYGLNFKGKKNMLKKWSVNHCKQLLSERNLHKWLIKLINEKKKDDLSDTFLMLQAFKFYIYIKGWI
jgi:hypothetical protein